MSLTTYYLRRTIEDLEERVTKVLLNDVEVPILDVTNNGRELIINTERIDDISRINTIKLLDEHDNTIIERTPNRNTEGNRSLEFRFEIEVE